MSINLEVENEPMWDTFDCDDDFLDSAADDLLDIPMEVEVEFEPSHHSIEDDGDGDGDANQDIFAVDWDLTDEIQSHRTASSPTAVSSSSHSDSSPQARSPSPIQGDLLTSTGSVTGGSTPIQRTPPPRTVSDNSSSLHWQLQQNARRFTDLMRRSDQTRSIVRQCRPPPVATTKKTTTTTSCDSSSEEDEDGCYNLEDQQDQELSSSIQQLHQQDFFKSEKCRELERSRRQLYQLLTQNYNM